VTGGVRNELVGPGRGTDVYRIDRPPAETVSLVERAIESADADEVYVEGNVVMGTIAPGGDGRTVWIVEVDLGAPPGVTGTLVSVAVRFNDDLLPGGAPRSVGSAPAVGQDVVAGLRSAAGEDFYRVPGQETEIGTGTGETPAGWSGLADDEAVTPTGMRSLGQDVYEVSVDGRTATVAVVRPERHDASRAVAVSTPLAVARAGTGFECYYDADDEFTRYDYGETSVELPEDVWRTVRGLAPFGIVTVDDRLGTVEHVLPRLLTDGDTLVAHASALTTLASAVETAVERQV
jgi:hypothetical protein